jgi:Flp pilus assembly protein TadG
MRTLLRSMLAVRAGGFAARSLLRRFALQSRASTTVEFALVATPFLALIFAIIETSIVFFADETLETAAANVGRLVLTGQAQNQGWSAAQFKQQVCDQIHALFNCASGVYVDVQSYSSFASANLSVPVTNGTLNTGNMGFNPGGPGQIVVVRLYYQLPAYVSMISLSNLTGGLNLLAATYVYKNEAY